MARDESHRPYKPDPNIHVSQKTIDTMKKEGMTKSIKQANSGTASPEQREGAKRMYGDRIKDVQAGPKVPGPKLGPPAPPKAVGNVPGSKGQVMRNPTPPKNQTAKKPNTTKRGMV